MGRNLMGEFVDYVAPSRMCGEVIGLPTIWCDWGLSNQEQSQAQLGCPWNGDFDRNLALHIVRHDAQLANFVRDDVELYHVSMGMLSQFVVDDILYFMQHQTLLSRPTSNEVRYERLVTALGITLMQWVPSRSTIVAIEDRLGIGR